MRQSEVKSWRFLSPSLLRNCCFGLVIQQRLDVKRKGKLLLRLLKLSGFIRLQSSKQARLSGKIYARSRSTRTSSGSERSSFYGFTRTKICQHMAMCTRHSRFPHSISRSPNRRSMKMLWNCFTLLRSCTTMGFPRNCFKGPPTMPQSLGIWG